MEKLCTDFSEIRTAVVELAEVDASSLLYLAKANVGWVNFLHQGAC